MGAKGSGERGGSCCSGEVVVMIHSLAIAIAIDMT